MSRTDPGAGAPAEIGGSPNAGAFDRWLRPEFGFPPAPGGEGIGAVLRRARRFLASLDPGPALLISHGYLLKVLLAHCLGGTYPSRIRGAHLPNAQPILLTRTSGQWHHADGA